MTLPAVILTPATTYALASHGAGTLAAYRSHWLDWSAWCARRGILAIGGPPDAVAEWIAERAKAGLSVSTVEGGLAALAHAHKLADVSWSRSRLTELTLEGIKRSTGVAPKKKAAAITPDDLRKLVAVATTRDAAIMMLGFGAALRRGEIASLDLADIEIEPEGVKVRIRFSKGDPTGKGELVPIARQKAGFCPVESLEAWLRQRGDEPGPLFGVMFGPRCNRLCGRSIARLIQAAARRAGLPVGISGHSLRVGLLTTAARLGKPLADLAGHARHKDVSTTAGYIRAANVWDNPVTEGVFG